MSQNSLRHVFTLKAVFWAIRLDVQGEFSAMTTPRYYSNNSGRSACCLCLADISVDLLYTTMRTH